MRDVFTAIYKGNLWSGRQSRSGTGSDLEETNVIREKLFEVLLTYNIKSLLDIPCGDMNWIKEVEFPSDMRYIGADIVPELIEDNKVVHAARKRQFKVLDITSSKLPEVDMVFVRDCLGHLSNAHVEKAVENIKQAKPKYLMATHWPGVVGGPDIIDGGWRPINMSKFLGPEWELIDWIEEDIKDKGMGIWKLNCSQN